MNMAEKTIKTDEVVHDELERLKMKYGAETFNDVLRHVLGIDPGTDIDKLTAYLNSELRAAAKELINAVEDVGTLERGYEKEYSNHRLTFKIPQTGRKVADIAFADGRFTVRYRDAEGEMKTCGRGSESSENGARYAETGNFSDRYDLSDVKESVNEKVGKAYRRWSQ